MKKLILFFGVILSLYQLGYAQLTGVHWNSEVFMFEGDNIKWFSDTPVDVDVTLRNMNGDVVYKEHHTATLDKASRFSLNIGGGVKDPNSPYDADAGLALAASLDYSVVVHDPAGDKTIMGSDPIGNVPSSLHAKNAQALGGYDWNTDPFLLKVLFDPDFSDTWCLLAKYHAYLEGTDYDYIKAIDSKQLFGIEPIATSIPGKTTFAAHLGLGEPHPLVFEKANVGQTDSYYTIKPDLIKLFSYGVGIYMPQPDTPLTRNTAAFYTENIHDDLGVGLIAKGSLAGQICQGTSGVIGQTNTTASGIGVLGDTPVSAPTGGFKYGISGNNEGHSNTYSGAFFGTGFYTGNWMNMSDQRLKSNIQSEDHGLETVLKLHPTTYSFRDDTPYHLAPGTHHGFIAQEVGAVIPDVVGDIVVPNSLDPNKMASSGTSTYKGINYTELIPILTNAIQELNAKVEAQATEIAALKKAIKTNQGK